MNKALLAALAAAVSILSAGPAAAQPMEGVTVEAARVIEVGRTVYGAPEQQVVIRRGVSYADLDLKTADGKAALEGRIKETAKGLCAELDKMYPLQDKKQVDCMQEAVKTGMDEATKLYKK